MTTLVKVTAIYSLDRAPSSTLNNRTGNSDPDDPTRFNFINELFIYRGWCRESKDGELEPVNSNFPNIRHWLADEFARRYPEQARLFTTSSFSRMCMVRGWPTFERLPVIDGLPQPQQESTS